MDVPSVNNSPSMIRGCAKRFFSGSKCFLGKMASEDLSNEACIVKSYFEDTQRWAVALLHPRFEGKVVLVREEKLKFDCYAADYEFDPPPPLPSYLFVHDFGDCGHALCCNEDVDEGTLLLDESPLMVVRDTGDAVNSRWNVYFSAMHREGPESPIIMAFNELADGDVIDEYIPDATNIFKEIVTKAGGDEMFNRPDFKAKVDAEAKRIATVLARWQTNGQSFRPQGCDDRDGQSALYRFGSKMLHSCEANCKRIVSEDSGKLVVRSKCAIRQGEQLTIDFMGGALDSFSVDERRLQLRKRGFVCQCSQCFGESHTIGEETQS